MDFLKKYFPLAPDSVRNKKYILFDRFYYILPLDKMTPDKTYSDSDLIYCRMNSIDESNGDDEYVIINGIRAVIDNKGQVADEIIKGIVVYPVCNQYNIVASSNGNLIRSSYTDESGQVKYQFLNLEWMKDKYKLFYVLKINDDFSVMVNVSGDLIFNTPAEAKKYSESLFFNYAELDSDKLLLYMNYRMFYFTHYSIFYKGQNISDSYDHNSFFDYLTQNVASSNKEKFNIKKKYRLLSQWLEIVPIEQTLAIGCS